ncbi:hypothetical protein PIB30_053816 [Stylosanthes scabra]|uniref:Uncharacterized protein n=1 Tax=Stylosanthes scabra TaxID=79078 RepID=A0ABU6QJB1_9FABA|nr:hypothetical protein [Stylosanthes scabra]
MMTRRSRCDGGSSDRRGTIKMRNHQTYSNMFGDCSSSVKMQTFGCSRKYHQQEDIVRVHEEEQGPI